MFGLPWSNLWWEIPAALIVGGTIVVCIYNWLVGFIRMD